MKNSVESIEEMITKIYESGKSCSRICMSRVCTYCNFCVRIKEVLTTCTYTNRNGTQEGSYDIGQIKSTDSEEFDLCRTGHEILKIENSGDNCHDNHHREQNYGLFNKVK